MILPPNDNQFYKLVQFCLQVLIFYAFFERVNQLFDYLPYNILPKMCIRDRIDPQSRNHILSSLKRLKAVSYTHLDVYKSQIHYSVTTNKTITQDYRIAFLSDLHFGNTMNKSELEKYCQDISLQKPDIVMLGGDIVDEHTTYQEMKEAFEVLGQIENQYGIYYVYGNHDQALYLNSPHFTPSQLKKSIEEHHISILLDSQVNIQDEMTIIGRQDRSLGEREDTQQLIKLSLIHI